ncbi:MAG: pilus assembly protein TadG-related protein [candidate division KSB1 bacterium]|nr:pilus assembly protein TadG-related protein [candidate division KSB1 bacterium]
MLGKFWKSQNGNTMVIVAASVFAIAVFAAMAMDIGYILVADKQLQRAVDAAALAGAAKLIYGTNEARDEAVNIAAKNTCMGQPVQLTTGQVTFPTPTQIRVQTERSFNTFFLRVVNFPRKTLRAEATAQIFYIKGTSGLAPFCVPNGLWRNGDRVVLKSGGSGETGIFPCWRYPVDFPPINRGNPVTGAAAFRDNLINGCPSYVEVGDILQIEPGNMDGPTSSAVNDIIKQDKDAQWVNGRVINSMFPGYTSPRILIVPMYDPNNPPEGGRGNVQVNALGAFFLEGMSGKDVIGVFMDIIINGTRGEEYSLLHKVSLIR